MSIRNRVALVCGALCMLVLLLIGLLSYAMYTRSQYDSLDRALVASAVHAADEIPSPDELPHPLPQSGDFTIALRVYDPTGALRESVPGGEALPAVDPRAALAAPAAPPFDALARLAPPLTAPNVPAGGAFGVLPTAEQRWRDFVLPVRRAGTIIWYVEALTPLGRTDAAISTFQAILLALGVIGAAAGLAAMRAVAGQALRPIATMVQTARTIARSRDLARRLAAPSQRDELRYLATTFNEMLASIEAAYAAQQRFVADASHELRAPLTVIQGNLELLRQQGDVAGTERAEALAEVEREAGRLARLVAELLILARADAGVAINRYPVDLDAVVLEVFQAARRLARGQALALEPFEPVQVAGDEDHLKQLVLILLDNALKYTPADGRVTLGLRRRGDVVEVVVRDTGVGIPADDLPRVFERFYRADPARSRDPGGSGLGLPIARWIAQQHGGTINLESRLGQGTTVIVRLPPLT